MALGDLAGRARLRRRNPSAQAECDRCSFWYNLSDLQRQFQWAGNALVDTGFLVCRDCLDTPQQQNRSLILPADPFPKTNPRPSYDVTPPAPGVTPDNQGFTQYVLGSSVPGLYPTTKADVLAQVAQLSGIATPPNFDRSITISPTNSTLPLILAYTERYWLLLYNPTNAQVQISKTNALWGAITNLILGPGEAYFWSTAQNFAPCYAGAMSAVGLTPNMPFWCWESLSATGSVLTTEDGVVITTEDGNPIIIS